MIKKVKNNDVILERRNDSSFIVTGGKDGCAEGHSFDVTS